MADETPTLRLELGGGELNTALGWTHTYLYLGDSVDAEVDTMLPNDVISALAAALDPATTATLFDQRDAAIVERDRLRAEVERMRPVLEAAQRWLEALKAKGWYGRGEEQPFSPLRTDLAAAVDVYNQPPSPDGETREGR